MSSDQLIAEFKALSPGQRQQVAAAILEDDSWIPDSFRQGMQDIATGKTVSLETVLDDRKPPGE